MRDASLIVALIGLVLMAFARRHNKWYMGVLALIVTVALIIFYAHIGS
jgi:hypothetical protein